MSVHVARSILVKAARLQLHAVRKCSSCSNSSYVKSYDVAPQCTVNGFISYHTTLIPHDPKNTTGSDKLLLKCNKNITVNQIGTSLNLTTAREPYDETTVCELYLPIKANVNLTCLGNVRVGNLQGDGVRVFSELGSVTLGSLKCDEVQAGTNDKDIITEGTMEATKVEFLCRRNGAIKVQNMKCLGLKMETSVGDIAMNACYAKQSYFVTKTGNMNLRNVHNRCRIEVLKKGKVNIMGMEGALDLALQNGIADLQIQKLYDDSDILVREEGEVTLRIAEELLDHVEIQVWSKGCYVDEGIPYVEDDANDLTTVRKKDKKPTHTLRVRCNKATCNVRLASWADMVERQFVEKKKQEGTGAAI